MAIQKFDMSNKKVTALLRRAGRKIGSKKVKAVLVTTAMATMLSSNVHATAKDYILFLPKSEAVDYVYDSTARSREYSTDAYDVLLFKPGDVVQLLVKTNEKYYVENAMETTEYASWKTAIDGVSSFVMPEEDILLVVKDDQGNVLDVSKLQKPQEETEPETTAEEVHDTNETVAEDTGTIIVKLKEDVTADVLTANGDVVNIPKGESRSFNSPIDLIILMGDSEDWKEPDVTVLKDGVVYGGADAAITSVTRWGDSYEIDLNEGFDISGGTWTLSITDKVEEVQETLIENVAENTVVETAGDVVETVNDVVETTNDVVETANDIVETTVVDNTENNTVENTAPENIAEENGVIEEGASEEVIQTGADILSFALTGGDISALPEETDAAEDVRNEQPSEEPIDTTEETVEVTASNEEEVPAIREMDEAVIDETVESVLPAEIEHLSEQTETEVQPEETEPVILNGGDLLASVLGFTDAVEAEQETEAEIPAQEEIVDYEETLTSAADILAAQPAAGDAAEATPEEDDPEDAAQTMVNSFAEDLMEETAGNTSGSTEETETANFTEIQNISNESEAIPAMQSNVPAQETKVHSVVNEEKAQEEQKAEDNTTPHENVSEKQESDIDEIDAEEHPILADLFRITEFIKDFKETGTKTVKEETVKPENQTAKNVNKITGWIDPSTPAKYVPVPGKVNLYMVIDDDEKVVDYVTKEFENNQYVWKSIIPEFTDAPWLTNLYVGADENGNVKYYLYERHEDGTYEFIETDENGKY